MHVFTLQIVTRSGHAARILMLLTMLIPIAHAADPAPAGDSELRTAEAFIDAFYTFDPARLRPLLVATDESATQIVYYQGWAEGGNYKLIHRNPCVLINDGRVNCLITVEDDPVKALKTGFNVTDTFSFRFEGGHIINVETSSNDQPIYYQAREWVEKEHPELIAIPCEGFFADGPTPGDCARAMTEGYRRFAVSTDYPETP